MRVLISGTSGLLGSDLKSTLTEKGHSVVDFKHRLDGTGFEKKYKGPYDWVIHCAAETNVDRCEIEHEHCWNVNALGTARMRDIAAATDARFLYISTASVFSGDEGNYKEYDRPYPENFYNLSKFTGEVLASEYKKSTIVRLVCIGIHRNGSRGRNFMEWLVDSYSSNKSVRLFKDIVINPLSTMTLAEHIARIIASRKHEQVVHLTSSDHLSKAAIGKLVLKRFPRYKGKVTTTTSSASRFGGKNYPKEMWLNSNRTARIFNLKRPSIHEELDRILKERASDLIA